MRQNIFPFEIGWRGQRPGYIFGATNYSSVIGITGQLGACADIGTDSVSLSFNIEVPDANPSAQMNIAGFSDTTRNVVRGAALETFIDTSRNLKVKMYGTTTSDWRMLAVSLLPWAGQIVHVVWDVRGGLVYLNGDAVPTTESTAGTPPTFASSTVTGTFLTVGEQSASTGIYYGFMSELALWNIALTAAQARTLFRRGGAPHPNQLGGHQQFIGTKGGAYVADTSTFAASIGDWATSGAGLTMTQAAGVATITATLATANATAQLITHSKIEVRTSYAKAYRFKMTIGSISGTSPHFRTYDDLNGFGGQSDTTLTNGVNTINVDKTASPGHFISRFFLGWNGYTPTAGSSFTVDDFQIQIQGCVAWYPMNEGGGLQMQDQSRNGNHILFPATGYNSGHYRVMHNYLKPDGWIYFRTNTNGNESPGQILDNKAGLGVERITDWLVYNQDSGSAGTMQMGTSSGAADIVASFTPSTTSTAQGYSKPTVLWDINFNGTVWVNSNKTYVYNHAVRWVRTPPFTYNIS